MTYSPHVLYCFLNLLPVAPGANSAFPKIMAQPPHPGGKASRDKHSHSQKLEGKRRAETGNVGSHHRTALGPPLVPLQELHPFLLNLIQVNPHHLQAHAHMQPMLICSILNDAFSPSPPSPCRGCCQITSSRRYLRWPTGVFLLKLSHAYSWVA